MLRVLFIWTDDDAGLRRRQLAALANGLRDWGGAVDALELATQVWSPRLLWRICSRIREITPDVIHLAGVVPAMLRGSLRLFSRALVTSELLPETASLRAAPTVAAADGSRILCMPGEGRNDEFKNALWVFDLLRLLDSSRKLQLTMAGPLTPQSEKFARRIGVADSVEFVGSAGGLEAVYSTIDLVWIPSPGPLASQAMVEAFSAGKPVLACGANLSVCQTLAETGAGRCFPPGDRIALARWSRHLWQNPELRRRMAESARKSAMRFQPRESARQLLLHYRQLGAPIYQRRAA